MAGGTTAATGGTTATMDGTTATMDGTTATMGGTTARMRRATPRSIGARAPSEGRAATPPPATTVSRRIGGLLGVTATTPATCSRLQPETQSLPSHFPGGST